MCLGDKKLLYIDISCAEYRQPRQRFRRAARSPILSCARAARACGRLAPCSAGVRAPGPSPVEAARAGRPAWRAERRGPPFRLRRFARAAVDPADSASAATRPAHGEEPAGPVRAGARISPARHRGGWPRALRGAIQSFWDLYREATIRLPPACFRGSQARQPGGLPAQLRQSRTPICSPPRSGRRCPHGRRPRT